MNTGSPHVIRFRRREEKVLEVFRVHGRRYFALEKLSRRGAHRVFDPHAGPGGDYRVLYRFSYSRVGSQKIETLRRLGGPTANRNFPHIVDCARQGRDYFVVMSWVWGTNLRELLRLVRSGKLPRPSVPEIVRLARGLAHGLSHYHRRANIVHGDISPANLIVTSGTKNLVLVDFGSAWPVEKTATKESGDGITVPYAAPERIAGHASEDFRADVFSLSVVAYELLTLQIPLDGAGGQAGIPGMVADFTPSLVAPSTLISPQPPRLPARALELLDEQFRVGLALHPDGRFATRREWLEAWDGLHLELQKGERLSSSEKRFLTWLEFLARPFLGRRA
jgi:serine/threonine protein kinase